ncbi:hypothetical protein CRUP_008133 [Coryphaenoides rupestris]|nr:hypothetical protein CRUP_008133 [Coryphaenoides rupestris]
MALQSGQLSWPSLLTQRKSLVYSALERESGPVSTNQTMDSEDPETPPEYSGSWGAVLQDLHKKMTTGGGHDLQGLEGDPQTPLHPIGRRARLNGVHSDNEGASKHCRSSQAFMKRQLPQGVRRPSSSRITSVISLNFNPEGTAGDESSGREGLKDSGVRRRRKSKKVKGSSSSSLPKSKKNHRQHASDAATPDTLTSEAVTLDPFHRRDVSVMGEELVYKLQQLARRGSLLDVVGDGNGGKEEQEKNGEPGEGRSSCGGDEDVTRSEKTSQEDRVNRLYQKSEEENQQDEEEEEEEEAVRGTKMEYNPCRLATQFYSSSLHPELNWACQKRRVRANRLSSMEDKLDQAGRGGTDDGEKDGGRARGELLATKLCRLAEQVSTGEFLSTDDDDGDKWESMGQGEAEERWRQGRVGLEEGESEEEETLMWTMEAEKAIQASQLRDLASLVSASQFCSTEDELDQVGGGEGEGGWNAVNGGDTKAGGAVSKKLWMMPPKPWRNKEMQSVGVVVRRIGWREQSIVMRQRLEGNTEKESSEDSSEDRRQLQTGQGEDTGRETNRDPIATMNKTRVSKDDVSGHELGVYNWEEEQMWLARTWRWAETKCDTSEHGDVETARIMSSVGDQRDKALDDVDGELDVASKETVEGSLGGHISQERDGSEMVDGRGDGTTLESICGAEGGGSETGGEDMGSGEDRIAGGGKEKGGIASGSQAGDFRSEEMDDASRRNGDIKPEDQTSILSPEEIQNRYSAVSLRSLTTEMLKVLNTTEALLQGVGAAKDPGSTHLPLSPDTDPLKLDQQFSRLEENVYVAAGTVFSLESELGDLEECARAVSGHTLTESSPSWRSRWPRQRPRCISLSYRIAALKSAGLNVDSQSVIAKTRMITTMVQYQIS